MKRQRKRTHISAHEGSTGGMPAIHSIYEIKTIAHPIEQCSLYALPSNSVRIVGSRVGVGLEVQRRENEAGSHAIKISAGRTSGLAYMPLASRQRGNSAC